MEQTYRDFTLQWHITHRCNLRCRHCYQDDYTAFDGDGAKLVLDRFAEVVKAYGCTGRLNLTGGEPLTHPKLFDILHEARARGMRTGVLTNGTLIGEWEARRLKASGVDYVQVSLDGCEKTHDRIRGKGSFDRAVNGIIALRSQGIFTSVSFTAQRQNQHELAGLARYCDALGADKLWFDRVVIPADEDEEQLTLSAPEFQRLCRTAARLNRRGKVFCGRSLQFLPCKNKLIYHCAAGENLLIVLANGDVMPCRRLPVVLGNVHETDLLTLHREHPVMQELRGIGIPDGCKACQYAETCRGGSKCIAYAKTGRYDIPDPDCPLAGK